MCVCVRACACACACVCVCACACVCVDGQCITRNVDLAKKVFHYLFSYNVLGLL